MVARDRAFHGALTGLLVGLMALGPTWGCASSTTITSEPSGAELRIDGAPVGRTPYTYVDNQTWLWSKHQVTLDKRGYEPTMAMIQAEINPLYLVLGIVFSACVFGLILILVGQYRPNYNFYLQRKSRVQTGDLSEQFAIQFSDALAPAGEQ